MRRRDFLVVLSGTAAWPIAARAEEPARPVVGLLRSTPAAPFKRLAAAFREGLSDEGFVDGRNITIEERWADNQLERLPALAADLVRLRASVIVGNVIAVKAARTVTASIPVVFVSGDDPVKLGLVASLSHPKGNNTGITFFGGAQLNIKQLEFLRELVPSAGIVAILGDSNYPSFETALPEIEAAGRALGRQIVPVIVSNARDFEPAFAKIVQAGAGALLISGSPFFTSQRRVLIDLAARHAVPTIYDQRVTVLEGGLISYSASFSGAYREAGRYAGKILKGAKPSELPVLQPTTFEFAINLKTAKALGLTVPPSLLTLADEVIE